MGTLNRRAFMSTTAASLAAANLARGAAGNKIKMGLIGCGWYGMVDVKAGLKTEAIEIVAVCDVDSANSKKAADDIAALQGSRPKEYKDYQALLEQQDLEAIILATPPHWHALQFIAACEKGLDIYCEKPFSYDIREGRAMVDAAKKSGRIIQIGFQRRQSAAVKAAAEFIQSGKAGEIKEVVAQINYAPGKKDATPVDPPSTLDWNQWCGPSPLLPYAECRGHFNWRLEKATGHGHLVDWGIHLIDAIRFTLRESTPTSVHTSGGLYYNGDWINTPDLLTARFEFATCPVTWNHRMWGATEYDKGIANGVMYYGTQATVFATDSRWEVIPARGDKQVYPLNTEGGADYLHFLDFIQAVQARKQPNCTPEDGYFSTTAVQLAMISYESGTKVEWDAKTENIIKNPIAEKLLQREYRKPWIHPYQG